MKNLIAIAAAIVVAAVAGATAVVAFAGAGSTHGDTVSHLDIAREMIRAGGAEQVYAQSFAAMAPVYSEYVNTAAIAAINQDPRMDAEAKRAALAGLAASRPKTDAAIQKILNDPKLIGAFVEGAASLHASYMTPEEMRQATVFYKTPAGQKTVASMPKLAETTTKINNDLIVQPVHAVLASVLAQVGGTGHKGQSQ